MPSLRFSLIVVLLMCLLAIGFSASAQEEPWYPAPETLFAPGVVVDSVTERPFTRPPSQPMQWERDNEARRLRILDPDGETWREFAFPAEIASIRNAELYEGTRWLITTEGGGAYDGVPIPSGQWLLDIESGVFSRPEMICGQVRETRPDMDGRWIVNYTEPPPEGERPELPVSVSLCHTKTLEQHQVIIDDRLENAELIPEALASPDSTRLAFNGAQSYYSYDIPTDMLLMLGTTSSCCNDVRVKEWYGSRYLLISEYRLPDSSDWKNYLVADATQADSLMSIGTMPKYGGEPPNLKFRSNPRRVEWVSFTGDSSGCWLNWLEYKTGVYAQYPIGDLCVVGTPLTDDPLGDRLFDPLSYESVEATDDAPGYIRTLYRDIARLNPLTGARTDLLRGEIEAVLDIDAGGNYATILLDSSGFFDLIDRDMAPYGAGYVDPRTPNAFEFAVLDLHTGEIRYRYPVANSRGVDEYNTLYIDPTTGQVEQRFVTSPAGDTPSGNLFALGDGEFVLRHKNVINATYADYEARLLDDIIVTIGDDGSITETPLPGILLRTMQDKTQFVLYSPSADDDEQGSIHVFNRADGSDRPLLPSARYFLDWNTDALHVDRYELSIQPGSASDTFDVKLYDNVEYHTVIYHVRLP
jgi:hypothetical protein